MLHHDYDVCNSDIIDGNLTARSDISIAGRAAGPSAMTKRLLRSPWTMAAVPPLCLIAFLFPQTCRYATVRHLRQIDRFTTALGTVPRGPRSYECGIAVSIYAKQQ